jgi:hypothetical protein
MGSARLLHFCLPAFVFLRETSMRNAKIFLAVAALFFAAASAAAQGTVPAATRIPVTLNQSVSSEGASAGEKVEGQVSEDVTVNGQVVIPRGSRVTMSVADVNDAGRFKGQPKLWLKIDSIEVRGRKYTASTFQAGRTGSSRGKRTAVGAGGGAAAGAIIGAIAGGGKGAAIGAAVGAGAGTAGAAATGSTKVEFPAETQLSFKLKSALTVR